MGFLPKPLFVHLELKPHEASGLFVLSHLGQTVGKLFGHGWPGCQIHTVGAYDGRAGFFDLIGDVLSLLGCERLQGQSCCSDGLPGSGTELTSGKFESGFSDIEIEVASFGAGQDNGHVSFHGARIGHSKDGLVVVKRLLRHLIGLGVAVGTPEHLTQ